VVGVALGVVLLSAACSSSGGGTTADTGAAGAGGATTGAGATSGAGATAGSTAASGGSVTVGLATTLSGSLAQLGEDAKQGVELAIADLNAKGGVLGKTVKLVTEDNQVTPATGTANARSLVLQHKAVALFGPISSAVAAAEQTVAAQYKTPLIDFMANDAGLQTKTFTKYSFQVVPNTTMEPRAAAAYLASKSDGKQITIGTFAPDYSFGHDSVSGFIDALNALHVNYKLVNQQYPPLGETNIAPYLSKLVAVSPDYVYNAQYGNDLVTFTKQAQKYNFFDKTTVIAMYGVQELGELGDQIPAGTIDFNRAPFWVMGAAVTPFVNEYKSKYGQLPPEWSLLGYTAVQTWAAGATKAGSFDGTSVSDALSGATIPTIRGDITLRACDNQAEIPEYVGVLTDTPDPTYGVPLWKPGSAFTAAFDKISTSC
jgi:branched-chain amino acid transport system substrate-binding protein